MTIIVNGSEYSQDLLDKIPTPGDIVPPNETNNGRVGTMTSQYAQADHAHPRLTSTTHTILDANGFATVMFTRTFTNKPGVVMTEVDATGNQPLVMTVQSFVMDNGKFAGCVVKGFRSQPLPNQNQITLVSLLTAVITSVNNLASSLTGYNVFGGTSAGAAVSVVAIARSDVPQ